MANTAFSKPRAFVDSRKSSEIHSIEAEEFYTTDAYADRAVDWIERHKEQPFLLYLPFNAQHAPLQATKKYLDRFPNITDEKRRTFAAMMSAMDDAVGRVLEKLREIKQEENTTKPHDVLYWRFGEQWAIRKGDWKLVASRRQGTAPLQPRERHR